jgi:alpha-beta hydrolase superfamily lysophospholipase
VQEENEVAPPHRIDSFRGLAYALWLPQSPPPWPGIVICHGAGSRKENHADFARLATANGWAALAFDARGHGDSEGEMSPDAVRDVVLMAELLGDNHGVDRERVAVRGSSMGGFLAIHAAASSEAIAGVSAFCPAGEAELSRGLRRGEFEMRVGDEFELEAWLASSDLRESVEAMAGRPLILLHAEGDDQIPSEWSEELYERASEPRKLVIAPGGDHRSLQHDAEMQSVALAWLGRQLGV